jgi:hypothetical protein
MQKVDVWAHGHTARMTGEGSHCVGFRNADGDAVEMFVMGTDDMAESIWWALATWEENGTEIPGGAHRALWNMAAEIESAMLYCFGCEYRFYEGEIVVNDGTTVFCESCAPAHAHA